MAQITIDIPNEVLPRLRAAFENDTNPGRQLRDPEGNPRPATLEDLEAFVKDSLKRHVVNVEQEIARRDAVTGVTRPDF